MFCVARQVGLRWWSCLSESLKAFFLLRITAERGSANRVAIADFRRCFFIVQLLFFFLSRSTPQEIKTRLSARTKLCSTKLPSASPPPANQKTSSDPVALRPAKKEPLCFPQDDLNLQFFFFFFWKRCPVARFLGRARFRGTTSCAQFDDWVQVNVSMSSEALKGAWKCHKVWHGELMKVC